MARVMGKGYSSITISGFKSQEEAEDYVSKNYQSVPVEVESKDSGYVFYFEDQNVGYGPEPHEDGMDESNWEGGDKLEDPNGNAVVSITAYEVGGKNAFIYEYADGGYRAGGTFNGRYLETGVSTSLKEVKRQLAQWLVGKYNQNGGYI